MPAVPTFGVEEEFLLVDRVTRRPVATAPRVIAAARETMDDGIEAEFFPTQVEIRTRPATVSAALRRELLFLRRSVAAAAAASGCAVAGTGTSVIPARGPIAVTPSPRYRRMARRVRRLTEEQGQGVCGCHVHLGIDDRDVAVAVSNHLRPWLPVVQAIAANSPFRDGEDSGYASWRAMRWERWPTAGPTPVFTDAASYDELADVLVRCGTLLDRRMIYWYARLSEHVPTLEIRVADSNADVDTTILLAVLVRGLATTVLADVEDGRPAPAPADELVRAAHWRAARDGLSGRAVDVRTGALVPAHELALALVERAEPGLAAGGDLDRVRAGLELMRVRGDGATRQRRAYAVRHRLRDVVDALTAATGAPAEAEETVVPS